MKNLNLHKILNGIISLVWIVNGLICKILNLVPRHEMIVASIIGGDGARILTALIGLAEIVMAIWILSKFKSKLNAVTQIVVVVIMNIIEFIFVPDLLLWGKFNSIFAFLFIIIVYYNEFVLTKRNI